jgi:hypothetical protein
MTEGFSRQAVNNNTSREPGAVIGVDVQTRTAIVLLRSKYTVNVNCAYAVGDTIITPAIGEQWYVERFDMEWRLAGRIPHNDPTLNIEPVEGQVSVGSASGPLELNGTAINVRTPLVLAGYATADRPSASTAGVGAVIYDLTLGIPVFSNGSVWRNATGTTV